MKDLTLSIYLFYSTIFINVKNTTIGEEKQINGEETEYKPITSSGSLKINSRYINLDHIQKKILSRIFANPLLYLYDRPRRSPICVGM